MQRMMGVMGQRTLRASIGMLASVVLQGCFWLHTTDPAFQGRDRLMRNPEVSTSVGEARVRARWVGQAPRIPTVTWLDWWVIRCVRPCGPDVALVELDMLYEGQDEAIVLFKRAAVIVNDDQTKRQALLGPRHLRERWLAVEAVGADERYDSECAVTWIDSNVLDEQVLRVGGRMTGYIAMPATVQVSLEALSPQHSIAVLLPLRTAGKEREAILRWGL
jgi:hypothetical protein